MLWPAGQKDFVFYGMELPDAGGKWEFGKLNAADFTQTALLTTREVRTDKEGPPLAITADGQQVAVVDQQGDQCRIRLARAGQAERLVAVGGENERLYLGSLDFSVNGDRLFASAFRGTADETNKTCGLLDIPLACGNRRAVRLRAGSVFVAARRKFCSAALQTPEGLSKTRSRGR